MNQQHEKVTDGKEFIGVIIAGVITAGVCWGCNTFQVQLRKVYEVVNK